MSPKSQNPRYVIVRAANIIMLAAEVDPKLLDGVWKCTGGPFYDSERREWCQAMYRPEPAAPTASGVKLREPKRQ
jgi:hypothetical protein